MRRRSSVDSPVISTTLLSWNRADLLQRTIDSYRATVSVPHEMFLVDNGSTDGSREVIERFCAEYPPAQALLLDDNRGGEAINLGLERSRGRLLHISENDLEYLPGWCERALERFEAFRDLGQLSLFGPVPTDEEAWEIKPCRLAHSRGCIVYQTDRNVGTSSLMRREVWDRGVRVRSLGSRDGHRFPADGDLSEDVRRAGFLVAWCDHYLVRNLGHEAAELRCRADYYRESYAAKPWLGEEGLRERLKAWGGRPRPRRASFLFPDAPQSPEKSDPTPECEQPQLWSMFDGWSAEVETLEFLYALVRLIKPIFAIETGTWHGYAARAIGRALRDNGRGRLVTLETDPDSFEVARARLAADGLDGIVEPLHRSSLDYRAPETIDFLLLDSALDVRADEFRHYLPQLRSLALVAFHDTSSAHRVVLEGIRGLVTEGLLSPVFFTTPRGLTLGQYGG